MGKEPVRHVEATPVTPESSPRIDYNERPFAKNAVLITIFYLVVVTGNGHGMRPAGSQILQQTMVARGTGALVIVVKGPAHTACRERQYAARGGSVALIVEILLYLLYVGFGGTVERIHAAHAITNGIKVLLEA